MALVIQCVNRTVPEPPPQVNIPNFGVIQKAWTSLDRIPEPQELLMSFNDQLAAAMAPVKRYLEMVEVMNSMYKCFSAIPDAVMQLSPDPIFDCLKNLVKNLARVLSWIPPLSYVRMGMDIASYVIDITDEIVSFFQEVDAKIGDYVSAYTSAQAIGDTELMRIIDCGAAAQKARLVIVFDLLKFVKPLNDALVDMFIRLLPGGDTVKQLKKIKELYEDADTYTANAATALRNGEALPAFGSNPAGTPAAQPAVVQVPPLGDFLNALNQMRSAMVMLYNLLAPIVGSDPNKQAREPASFTYF